jgi:hypothetical protein
VDVIAVVSPARLFDKFGSASAVIATRLETVPVADSFVLTTIVTVFGVDWGMVPRSQLNTVVVAVTASQVAPASVVVALTAVVMVGTGMCS